MVSLPLASLRGLLFLDVASHLSGSVTEQFFSGIGLGVAINFLAFFGSLGTVYIGFPLHFCLGLSCSLGE